MKFLFQENEEIYNKNKSRGLIRETKFVLKPKKKGCLKIINKKIVRVYSNCLECGELLEHKASKYLGICPSCDNL